MICKAKKTGDIITITVIEEKPIVIIASGSVWGNTPPILNIDGGSFGDTVTFTLDGGSF
jgi:hypothetical protein